jgi:hypothetical protein
MTAPQGAAEPSPDAAITPLAIPLFMTAGVVNGAAVALCRDSTGIHYLVDNAPADGPPIWVHEGQIERCSVLRLELEHHDR